MKKNIYKVRAIIFKIATTMYTDKTRNINDNHNNENNSSNNTKKKNAMLKKHIPYTLQ